MALMTKNEYIESLRRMKRRVFILGERVENMVDHPLVRPSLNACAMTYELAQQPDCAELMLATSNLTGQKVNRFTHLHQNAADLVGGIKRINGDFEISVSAYPEKHPESPTVAADIDMLKAKVDAGAGRAITQFFFENDLYFRYLDRVRARGIDIPIVPGILPVQNFKAATNFATRAGASVPVWLAERFQGLDNDPTTRKLIAAAVAAEQVVDLFDRGVTTFHFYTMNRADLVYAICHLLGLRPVVEQAA